jgi:hypothetical protein
MLPDSCWAMMRAWALLLAGALISTVSAAGAAAADIVTPHWNVSGLSVAVPGRCC